MRSFFLACIILFGISEKSAAQVEASTIIEGVSALHDTVQFDSLMTAARPMLLANRKNAQALLEAAEAAALRQSDSLRWATALTMHAYSLPDSQSVQALSMYEKAIPLLRANKHRYQIQALSNASEILILLGDYEQAITYQQWSLDFARASGNTGHLIALTTNMGYFYDRIHDYAMAETFQKRALNMATEQADTFMLGLIHMRLGLIMDKRAQRHGDSALFHLNEALERFRALEDPMREAQALGNLGNIQRKNGDPSAARLNLMSAARLNRTLEREHSLAINVINMGKVLFDLGQHSRAIDTLKSGFRLARSVGDRTFELEALDYLHQTYKAEGDLKAALRCMNRYTALKDSVLTSEKLKQVSNLQVRYETLEKEGKIAALNEKNALAALELSEQRNKTFLIAGLALLAIIVLLALIGITRQRQKNMLNQKEIEFKEGLIDAQITSQEEERQRIAKELHDGIAQSLAAIKLQFQSQVNKLKSVSPDEQSSFSSTIDTLDDACQEVRAISHQMMPRALMEMGLVSAIEDMLHKSLSFTEIKYVFEHMGMEDGALEKRIEIAMYRICQELINNVVKHSYATEVSVQLYTTAHSVILIVEDNGKGIKKGADSGIGMHNINSRASAINGKVSFEDNPESGTVAQVRIPIGRTNTK